MSAAGSVPPVADAELLARFIRFRAWVRADQTIRPDAFIPPPDLELSVTRHALSPSAEWLWDRGRAIAGSDERGLFGRADLYANAVRAARPLDVQPAALPEDIGHAHVVGWPGEKAARKALAQQLAAASNFVQAPGA